MLRTLALAGDTMLGRSVAGRLTDDPDAELFDAGVRAVLAEADLRLVNLECCISDRGERWPDPFKPFFFRAPPVAARRLRELGIDAVTLANNHALDYGADALLDTLTLLDGVGIAHIGAGPDVGVARRPLCLGGLSVLAFTDHPADFAAGAHLPGVAFADGWIDDALRALPSPRLVTPHWGPNMTPGPLASVRRAAEALVEAGATLIAGHSAHVFHGVRLIAGPSGPVPVLYDLGDFLDDYATDPVLRNDRGLLWLVRFEGDRPVRVEAVPIALGFCHTSLAVGPVADWITDRFRAACAAMGTAVRAERGRLVVDVPV